MFRAIRDIQGRYLLPLSVVLQAYAIVHITCYKWKYKRQDNRVHVFTITLGTPHGESNEDPESHQEPEPSVSSHPANTQAANNEILFGIINMCSLVLCLGVILFSVYYISNLWTTDVYNGVDSIIYILHEFFPLLVANTVFPCYFYLSNSNARNYFKNTLFQ